MDKSKFCKKLGWAELNKESFWEAKIIDITYETE